jgi:restriction system protein
MLIDRAVIDNLFFSRTSISAAVAVLVEFDVSDLTIPLQICRNELCSRPMSRLEIHPRRIEEVVASVFSDLGYETELTAYSRDGGVDMFLRGADGALSAVQVKRYKGSIGAEQIRSFVGALLLRGVSKGVYVTTSGFTKGAVAEAGVAASKGIPIELIDCKRLFEYLRLAQVKRRSSFELSDVGLEPEKIQTRPVWMEALKG